MAYIIGLLLLCVSQSYATTFIEAEVYMNTVSELDHNSNNLHQYQLRISIYKIILWLAGLKFCPISVMLMK